MQKLKIVVGLAVAVLAVVVVWQVAAAEIGNLELREDLRDAASEMGARVGLSAPSTEEDLRGFVIQKARAHDIALEPKEVTVQVTGAGEETKIYLAAEYAVRVNLGVFSFPMRFKTTSER